MMTSLHVICGLAPPLSKILAAPMCQDPRSQMVRLFCGLYLNLAASCCKNPQSARSYAHLNHTQQHIVILQAICILGGEGGLAEAMPISST